jgi:uncharacterized repeat protein (TIGR04076 family)
MYDLKIVVEEIEGFCDLPMEVGDYFTVSGGKIKIPDDKHMCLWALQSLMPVLPAKEREISEENDWIPHTKRFTCPDPNGRVIFRIDRLDPKSSQPIEENTEIPARIQVDPEACTGCRACETVCAFIHTKSFNGEKARIKINKDEIEGEDIPYVCRQCGDAPCVKACPVNALSRDPNTNAILVDEAACIGCYKCAKACPFDAITFTENDTALICDLCEGEIECVKRCPTEALKFDNKGGRN